MDGERRITRCPCCGKVVQEHIGATKYFGYKNRRVRITRHCGDEFITTDENIELMPTHRYFVSEAMKSWIPRVVDMCINSEEVTDGMKEDEAVAYILDKLDKKYKFVDKHKADLTMMTQIVLSRLKFDIFTELLNDKNRAELVPNDFVML